MPCKSEIANLQLVGLGANEQVLRLNVSVHNVLAMKIVNCLQELIDEELNAITIKSIRFFFENLKEIAVHELENQVQAALPVIEIEINTQTYLLNASIIFTTDLSLRTLSILTSRFVVFFTI